MEMKLLLYPEPIITVILQAIVELVSVNNQESVAPAVPKVYVEFIYAGVVVIDLGLLKSIVDPPTPPYEYTPLP